MFNVSYIFRGELVMSNYTKEKPKEETIYCCPECDAENDGKEGERIICYDCGEGFYAV